MSATDKRKKVRDKYSEIIGRNIYSQAKRNYCYKKYSDGKYYSDCSSSVSYAYKEAGYGFGILNTVGMYQSKKFSTVPVKIVKGQIQNPEVLRIGDMLLYAGSDTGRGYCGYVGHVEMYWGYDGSGKHWLYGHGSGNPKKSEMTSKNRSRYNSKTNTPVGNKGLIKVVRFIQDDGVTNDTTSSATTATANTASEKTAKVKPGTWFIRNGAGQEFDAIATIAGGTAVVIVDGNGWKYIKVGNVSGFISEKALEGLD